MDELRGVWKSVYSYSQGISEHEVIIDDSNGVIIADSLPNAEGSELHMRLTCNGDLLGGTWSEKTSRAGRYKGTEFKGHVDFVITSSTKIEGLWIGHNRDKSKINFGEWTLEKLQ